MAETRYETEEESINIDSYPSDSNLESLNDLEDDGEIPPNAEILEENYDYSEESDVKNAPPQSSSSSSSSSSRSTSNLVKPEPNPGLDDDELVRRKLINSTVALIIANRRQVPPTPIVTDTPLRTPQYNMEQVASAFKQSITGGLDLQKPLFIIDTPSITGAQAAQFQNQAN